MLARLSKTLSTNAAIAGTVALVIGASGGAAAYTAGSDTPTTPGSAGAEQGEHDADTDADATEHDSDAADQGEAPDAPDTGVRPTDTHGYCVSRVAQAPVPAGSTVTHGSLVSAAAHSCGKTTAADKAARVAARSASAATTHGKGFGRHHGTGRPAALTTGH